MHEKCAPALMVWRGFYCNDKGDFIPYGWEAYGCGSKRFATKGEAQAAAEAALRAEEAAAAADPDTIFWRGLSGAQRRKARQAVDWESGETAVGAARRLFA